MNLKELFTSKYIISDRSSINPILNNVRNNVIKKDMRKDGIIIDNIQPNKWWMDHWMIMVDKR